jgi:hypothetical protein
MLVNHNMWVIASFDTLVPARAPAATWTHQVVTDLMLSRAAWIFGTEFA